MLVLIALFVVFVAMVAVFAWVSVDKELSVENYREPSKQSQPASVTRPPAQQFYYSRKASVMTVREAKFFRRLESIVKDKYYIFPQMHLSAVMFSKTMGRYKKLSFQRINRTSVDYVLCDRENMQPVYAVELDDYSHDTSTRRSRDEGVERMLESVYIPLVRFRNAEAMSDQDVIRMFQDAIKD